MSAFVLVCLVCAVRLVCVCFFFYCMTMDVFACVRVWVYVNVRVLGEKGNVNLGIVIVPWCICAQCEYSVYRRVESHTCNSFYALRVSELCT